MDNYAKLVEIMRLVVECDKRIYPQGLPSIDILISAAADAIEELQHEIKHWEEAVKTALDFIPIWIPVGEHLPEADVNVLVRSGSFVSVWSLREGAVYWEDGYGYFHDMCEVTHWMPLPEPPKEENT